MPTRLAGAGCVAVALIAIGAVVISARSTDARAQSDPALETSSAAIERTVCVRATTSEQEQLCAQFAVRLAAVNRDANQLASFARVLVRNEIALAAAMRALQDSPRSSSLQNLVLQSAMQQESRVFSMISNIMKTKHDTVKNTIANMR